MFYLALPEIKIICIAPLPYSGVGCFNPFRSKHRETFANSVVPDDMDHNEPPLRSLSFCVFRFDLGTYLSLIRRQEIYSKRNDP